MSDSRRTDFSSKAIVVTGGGRGIGLGLARELASRGAAVVINDNGVELDGGPGDENVAEAAALAIRNDGGRGVASALSIADPSTAAALVETALAQFGRLDGWVNAATITRDRMLFNMSDEEWSEVRNVDLDGTFYGMRAALRHMKQQKAGRLVNLISTSGLIGNFGQANYAASKAGAFALTRVAALEMRRYGVAVNCVAPFAHTRMTESIKGVTPEQQAYLEKARQAKVEHILPFLVYLLGDESADVSGQIFGMRGCEVFLFSQPRPVRTLARPGGWDDRSAAEAVADLSKDFVPIETDLELFQSDPVV